MAQRRAIAFELHPATVGYMGYMEEPLVAG
jgi:hypothetical protein